MSNPTVENHEALAAEVSKRMMVDKTFSEVFPHYKVGESASKINFECYRELIAKFEDTCFSFDDYSMKYMGMLAKECEIIQSYPEAQDKLGERLNATCNNKSAI
jgi:hypothetical protein